MEYHSHTEEAKISHTIHTEFPLNFFLLPSFLTSLHRLPGVYSPMTDSRTEREISKTKPILKIAELKRLMRTAPSVEGRGRHLGIMLSCFAFQAGGIFVCWSSK